MKMVSFKTVAGIFAGFLAGVAAANLPTAFASPSAPATHALEKMVFNASVFEIKQQLTPGDFLTEEFSGSYTRTFTMSDGKQRKIELTPMMHQGMQVVRIKDNSGVTYSSLDGLTLNGTLLISLENTGAADARLKAEGWKLP